MTTACQHIANLEAETSELRKNIECNNIRISGIQDRLLYQQKDM